MPRQWVLGADIVLPGAGSSGTRLRTLRSADTGLRVVLAEVEGPVVSGYMTLATEAVTNDYARADDGLPHTLEHLVFLGSEKYPYKGVLDRLANRCLAEGTNAWTDTDHTAYTLSTAGCDGFLNLLPIYCDHVLYPTITDSGFVTEVHHVQPDGEDAGVVYCEMQARENTADSLTHLALRRALFPRDGFASETGGLMANLRDLKVDQVRRYHRDYYRPDNLCIIVTGQVPLERLLAALEPVEADIRRKGALPAFARPWTTPVAPLPSDTLDVVDVPFPTQDEESGQVTIGWRGPAYHDATKFTALRVMWLYLTQSSVSPLQRAFVECEDPYCADVDFNMEEGTVALQYVTFEDVHTEKLDDIRALFFKEVRAVIEGGVDMARIAMVVARERRRYLNSLESNPHDTLAGSCISAFLYADEPADGAIAASDALAFHVDMLSRLDTLPTAPEDGIFWEALLQTSLLDARSVTIVGRPSAALGEENSAREKARVAARAAELGEAELRRLGEVLDAAIEANEVPPPDEMMEAVPVPSLSSVAPHGVITVTHSPGSSLVPSPRYHKGDLAASATFPRSEPSGAAAAAAAPMAASAVLPSAGSADSDRRASSDMSSSTSSAMSWQLIDEEPGAEDASDGDGAAAGAGGSSTGTMERGGWCTRLAISVPDSTTPGASDKEGKAVRDALVNDGLTPAALAVEAQWDHVHSSFVRATAALDTRSVPDRLRPLADLFVSSLFELPIQEPGGELIPYDTVVKSLMSESVSYSASLGFGGFDFGPGTFSQLAIVTLKFEAASYAVAARWLQHILLCTQFTPDRVRVVASKLLSGASSTRRAGRVMASTLMRDALFHPTRSNMSVTNVVKQQRFLQAVLTRLETSPEEVCGELEEFRAYVTHASRMRLHIASDILHVDHPAKPWLEYFSPAGIAATGAAAAAASLPAAATMRHAGVQFEQELVRADARLDADAVGSSGDRLVALSSVETSYLLQATRGLMRYDAEDTAALMVALEYLTALEGDFWRKIRGLGLSYSYGISSKPSEGTLVFQLFKSTNVGGAYKQAATIVDGYVTGATPLSEVTLEASKSTVVYSLVAREDTVAAAASQSFRNTLRGVQPGHNQALARRVLDVSLDDVLTAMQKYLPPLFDPRTSTMVVATGVATKDAVLTDMAALGRQLTDVGSLDTYFGEEDVAALPASSSSSAAGSRPASSGAARGGARGGSAGDGEEAGMMDTVSALVDSALDSVVQGGWTSVAVGSGVVVAALVGWWLVRRKRSS